MRRACLIVGLALVAACEAPGTELLVPLRVINWYPSGNAACVPRDTGIFVTFSEPLAAGSVTAETIALLEGTTPVPGRLAYAPDTATVSLWPDAGLTWATGYVVRLAPELAAEGGALLGVAVESRFTVQPQLGCLEGLECLSDRDCEPRRCSVTGVCVDGCAVAEDCPPGQLCAGGTCTP